ncbi:hypothetical protein ACF0H5_011764 [Mactra antiquata]
MFIKLDKPTSTILMTRRIDSKFFNVKVNQTSVMTMYRSYVNILTAFSILAVDFRIYPRYFHKSKTYGTSLMDTGLGFFLVSNAFVSPEARGLINKQSFRTTGINVAMDTIPLLILGTLRYVVLDAIEYSVYINDYGLHWNFFFTLVVIKLCSVLLYSVTPKCLRKYLGLVIICLHQSVLMVPAFLSFVLDGYDGNGSRDGIIDANREGIVSCVGFLGLYLIGVEIGTFIMKRRETVYDHIKVLLYISVISSTAWFLLDSVTAIQPPSRRLANSSYVVFMIGLSTFILIPGLLVTIFVSYMKKLRETRVPACGTNDKVMKNSSNLLEAVNYNGLAFFVVANLLTGLVNIAIDTREQSDTLAFIYLTLYMLVLCILFSLLYKYEIKVKTMICRSMKRSTSADQR